MSSIKFHDRHEVITEQLYSGELLLPHRYVFVLTNICNLQCDFCFQERDKREDAMSENDWLNLVKQLPDYARVTLTGGEPLAFKEFDSVFNAVSDAFQCNMITNGLLLTPQKIDLLLSKPNFKVLSISIDDIGNINRDVRPRQWEKMVDSINYFHQRKKQLNSGCVLDIKTVILDKNAHQLFEIHKYCVEILGAQTHAFQFLKGSGLQHSDVMSPIDAMYEESYAPTYECFEEIHIQLEKVRQYNLQSNSKVFVHPKICDLSSDQPLQDFSFINVSKFHKENFLPCKFPWSSVHVNVDGNMFPCISFSMGNVKEQSLSEIVQSESSINFRKAIKESLVEGCNRCGWIRPKEQLAIIPLIKVPA